MIIALELTAILFALACLSLAAQIRSYHGGS